MKVASRNPITRKEKDIPKLAPRVNQECFDGFAKQFKDPAPA
jgi:hypothetical protein